MLNENVKVTHHEHSNSVLLPNNTADDEHRQSSTSAISIGKRFIANLIPSSAFQPLKIPFSEEEHYLVGSDSSYYVNDKNLSSIVAFTLT